MTAREFMISEEENARYIRAYFRKGADGPLDSFPTREKRRFGVLRHLVVRFAPQRTYTEKEVDTILGKAFHDHVTLRRALVDFGFLDRHSDGSSYWVRTRPEDMEIQYESALPLEINPT